MTSLSSEKIKYRLNVYPNSFFLEMFEKLAEIWYKTVSG